ncbi:MAG TPA: RNA methyltransferase [Rhodobacteraceae bacterium]|nr:RNA methyltransferase [Paracoccaceae bacterium]
MRGYFAIGAEGISKPMNLGNLMRSACAFGASFFFTVDAERNLGRPASDTAESAFRMPYYDWRDVCEMKLPRNCRLIGIELKEDAIDLPSFRHPAQAAYVLGPERGSLSPEMLSRCDFVVKIPTTFCINVATAGAIVMYDRVRSLGRFAPRPVRAGGPTEILEPHRHGGIYRRRK